MCIFDSVTIWHNYYDPPKTFLCAQLTAAMAKIVVLVLAYALIGIVNFEIFTVKNIFFKNNILY